MEVTISTRRKVGHLVTEDPAEVLALVKDLLAQGSMIGIVAVRTRSYGGCSYVAANIGRVQEGNCRLQLAAAFTAGPYNRSRLVPVSKCLDLLERRLKRLVDQRSSQSTDSDQEDDSDYTFCEESADEELDLSYEEETSNSETTFFK